MAAVLALGIGFTALLGREASIEKTYREHYTAEGKCLDDSDYDTNNGATTDTEELADGSDLLTVTPHPDSDSELKLQFVEATYALPSGTIAYLSPVGNEAAAFFADECTQ